MKLIEQAKAGAPLEVCAYLAAGDGIVSAHYSLTNIDASADHFSMDPAEQFATVRSIRGAGLTLAAVAHSHPASPARLSEEDIRLAADPSVSYVIVSLAGGSVSIKSFRILAGSVTEEHVDIV